MNYTFIDSLPSSNTEIDSFLRDKGYTCDEEETSDCVRWVYYYKKFKQDSSNVIIRVVLRFELYISDSPTASYDENHYLSFNDAYLELYDRQMREDGIFFGEKCYDEETESVRRIDSFAINPQTFEDIDRLIAIPT